MGLHLTRGVNLKAEGITVLLRFDEGLAHALHWQAALELGQWLRAREEDPVMIRFGALEYAVPLSMAPTIADGLRNRAKAAEEWAERERIADDGALLLRVGAPIGLTDHPKIRDEIGKRAVSDRDLRRYLPGGVKGKTLVGAPRVILRKPAAKEEIR